MPEPERAPPRPRVASWPHWYRPNPYLPALYDGLARRGIDHVADVPLEPELFAGPDRAADFLHLHWLYPLFRDGASRWRPGRAVRAGLRKVAHVQSAGVPVLWTVHNIAPHDGFRRGERAGYAEVYRTADLRVFHSESAREAAAALHGPPAGDSVVAYHGGYEGAFPRPGDRDAARARLDVGDGDRLLLCFGQIRAYKGFELAVQAMALVTDARYRLVVAGRAIDRSVKLLRRRTRGLGSVRIVAEEVPAQDAADLLHACDAVLLPYLSITGSGVLLHALTAGKAVIASDLPYFREVLGPEPAAGVLFEPGSTVALAEGIRAFFAADPAEREAAAARLARRYAWSDTVGPLADWILARHAVRPTARKTGG